MSDNPAILSFPFHLGGPSTKTSDKQFSIYVSRTLDVIGKNQDMVKYRVKMHRMEQECWNMSSQFSTFKQINAGSKPEGLTSIYESDLDIMFVYSEVICADNVIPFIHNRDIAVFSTDRHTSPAGYTKLKLVKCSRHLSAQFITHSLIKHNSGDSYLSSELFVTTLQKVIERLNNNEHQIWYEQSGPSLPCFGNGHYKDNVFAFRCVCSSLLQIYLTRPRPTNRPSCNELRDISVLEAHVVPVGHKGSKTSHLEWRICFTRAEMYLIQRLNDTETKLYSLLKTVSKLLQFFSKDITSYVMKNVVLWLVELYPVDVFIEDLLTYKLIQALRFLHKCVQASYLPSYMIPERNLLVERLHPIQRLQLTTFLSTLIQERGYLLLRCEKLRYGMTILYRDPAMAEEFRWRRDMYEKLFLLSANIIFENKCVTGLSREEADRLMDIEGTVDELLTLQLRVSCPDLMFMLSREFGMQTVRKSIMERHRQLLS